MPFAGAWMATATSRGNDYEFLLENKPTKEEIEDLVMINHANEDKRGVR